MNQCVGKALLLYVGLNMDHVLLCGIIESWEQTTRILHIEKNSVKTRK